MHFQDSQLENIRNKCSETEELIGHLIKQFRSRRSTILEKRKSLYKRWKASGPRTKEDAREFGAINQKLNDKSLELVQVYLEDSITATALYLDLLSPEELDDFSKITYASKLLDYLNSRKDEFIPTLTNVLLQIENIVNAFADFVDSRVAHADEGFHGNVVPLSAGDVQNPDVNATNTSHDDDMNDAAARIVTRQAFLDDPEYRRVAKLLFEDTVMPLDSVFSQFSALQSTQKRAQEAFWEWQSKGERSADQYKWVIEHFKANSEISQRASEMMKKMTARFRRANQTFEAAFDLGTISSIEALNDFYQTRRELINDEVPLLRDLLNLSVVNAKETIEYFKGSSEAGGSKWLRQFFRTVK